MQASISITQNCLSRLLSRDIVHALRQGFSVLVF